MSSSLMRDFDRWDTRSKPGRPPVTVVLPIYNRLKFLAAAFDSIRSQAMPALEVIVVDDGSTDGSADYVAALAASYPHPIHYIRQENQGAYGARNTGVAAASGDYLAFYDSDDVWLPHHLSACVEALDAHADVDWVYSASEIVDLDSGAVIAPNCFYSSGSPRPFMRLAHENRGRLRVITDAGAIRCQIDHGLYCGLQNSVIRRRVFESLTLESASRNEAEDQLFAIRALAARFRLAYFDAVHVRYHVHGENSSGAAKDASVQKRRRLFETLVAGYERLPAEIQLSGAERRALRRRVARELFWHLGYSTYWERGDRTGATRVFRRALRVWPWNPALWKTYLLAVFRTLVRPQLSVRDHVD